jgi:hypothetical protein
MPLEPPFPLPELEPDVPFEVSASASPWVEMWSDPPHSFPRSAKAKHAASIATARPPPLRLIRLLLVQYDRCPASA